MDRQSQSCIQSLPIKTSHVFEKRISEGIPVVASLSENVITYNNGADNGSNRNVWSSMPPPRPSINHKGKCLDGWPHPPPPPHTHTNTISKNATKDGITLGPLSNMRRTSTCMLQGCRGKIGVSDINGAKQTHMQRQNGGGYHQNHCNSNLCSGVAKVKLKV